MQKRVAIVLVCLLLTAAAVIRADRQERVPLREPFTAFPMNMATWRGVAMPPLTEQVEKVLGADDYLTRAYYTPERQGVGLFIGYWQSQKQGDTIHSPLNCLPGAGWEPVSNTKLSFKDPRKTDGTEITVNRVMIQKGTERQLVLYWYQSHGRVVASEYWGKFYLMSDAMRLNRTDGSIVRVISYVPNDSAAFEQAAEKLSLDFINVMMPELSRFLPE